LSVLCLAASFLFLLSGCKTPADTTDKQKLYSVDNLSCKKGFDRGQQPIFVVNGRIVTLQFVEEKLYPENVKTIEVERCNQELLREWGPGASVGVAFVETIEKF